MANTLVLSASLVTKAHPGAGRSPGVVDLPVARDPLGYPFVPGSMVKGSFRTLASKSGDKGLVGCLFGPWVDEAEKHAGALAFSDLYPLFIPAPSRGRGVVYVTTPYLLSRSSALLYSVGFDGLAEALESLASSASEAPVGVGVGGTVPVGGVTFEDVRAYGERLEALGALYEGLNPLYNSIPPATQLLVVPESMGSMVVEGLLYRVTRVRINKDTKTVEHGGLWTEEYIPWGTLLLGAVIDTGHRGRDCDGLDPLSGLAEKVGKEGYLVIGGKETVGAGLARYKLVGVRGA